MSIITYIKSRVSQMCVCFFFNKNVSENSTTLNHWKFEFKVAFKVFSFNVPREKIDQQHGKAAKQSVSWISEYSRKERGI